MKPIEKYNLKNEEGYHYKSLVCSVACEIGNKFESHEISSRIVELTQSYFNQWKIVISTYEKLDTKFRELNTQSDQPSSQSIINNYDIHSIKQESFFSDYAYMLVIGMKTLLDLIACVVDISINRKDRNENDLPDFFTISNPKKRYVEDEIREKFKSFNSYPELLEIKEIRNKLIHRGYNLKPSFAFSKTDQLVLQVHKGVDFYTCDNFNVGKSFESFINCLDKIEVELSEILIKNVQELNNSLSYEASFTFDESWNSYNYKEL